MTETLTVVLVNKTARTLWWSRCDTVIQVSLWDETGRRKLFWRLSPNCNPSKVNPPEFTSIVAPPLCCREARRHFKVIFPTSNFTLGYARVQCMRTAIILNTCFRRYFVLSLCAFNLRWWSANEETGRCILTEVLWGILKDLVSVILLCPSLGKEGPRCPARHMGNKWATSSAVSVNLRDYARSPPAIRWLFDRHCWDLMQANEL